MRLELHLGYNGPVKVWVDGQAIWHDPDRKALVEVARPVRHEAAVVPWNAKPGPHEVTLALAIDEDTRGSMFARFCRKDVTGDRLRTDPDQLLPVGE